MGSAGFTCPWGSGAALRLRFDLLQGGDHLFIDLGHDVAHIVTVLLTDGFAFGRAVIGRHGVEFIDGKVLHQGLQGNVVGGLLERFALHHFQKDLLALFRQHLHYLLAHLREQFLGRRHREILLGRGLAVRFAVGRRRRYGWGSFLLRAGRRHQQHQQKKK